MVRRYMAVWRLVLDLTGGAGAGAEGEACTAAALSRHVSVPGTSNRFSA